MAKKNHEFDFIASDTSLCTQNYKNCYISVHSQAILCIIGQKGLLQWYVSTPDFFRNEKLGKMMKFWGWNSEFEQLLVERYGSGGWNGWLICSMDMFGKIISNNKAPIIVIMSFRAHYMTPPPHQSRKVKISKTFCGVKGLSAKINFAQIGLWGPIFWWIMWKMQL